MEVRLTSEMFEVLKATPEMPANLAARMKEARADGDHRVLDISDDERMALEEMCQWYVIKDPETGKLKEKGVIYDSIIDAIYDADLG